MSVLIRGMEMPKSCKSCDLLQDYGGDMFCPLNSYLNFGDIENVPDYVMDACPLVEVKSPHGRLIDADEMVSLWKGCTFEGDITCLLDPRPTVLESEE